MRYRTILAIAIVSCAATCFAQAPKAAPDTTSVKLEEATLKRLHQLEAEFRNFDNPLWVDAQKQIRAAGYEAILTTLLESKGIDPTKATAQVEGRRLKVTRIPVASTGTTVVAGDVAPPKK